ncbi:MAG: LytR/AlgR family response regulator transcription factor [Candidatus Weimeria sp.]
MLRIAICDDCEASRKDVVNHLMDYSVKNNFDYTVDEYGSGESLIRSGIRYDLIFMDYQFEEGGCDGIEISKKLREKGDDTVIIFLSAYPEAVYDSFDVNAFSFLIKPVNKKKFDAAIDRFISDRIRGHMLMLHEVGKNRYVNKHDIIYLEGNGKKCILHFTDRKKDFECNKTLASIEEMIDDDSFYRCQKSYVINLDHVSGYNSTAITMDNGSIVMISRKKYREFIERYGDFILKGKTLR